MSELMTEQRRFARRLLSECEPTDEGQRKWLAFMRFGIGTLESSPQFLMCLVVERAYQCFAHQKEEPLRSLGEWAAQIAYELSVELRLKEPQSEGIES